MYSKIVGNSSILRACIYIFVFLSLLVYLVLNIVVLVVSYYFVLIRDYFLRSFMFIVKGMLILKLGIYVNVIIN